MSLPGLFSNSQSTTGDKQIFSAMTRKPYSEIRWWILLDENGSGGPLQPDQLQTRKPEEACTEHSLWSTAADPPTFLNQLSTQLLSGDHGPAHW